MPLSLVRACQVCGATDNLFRCEACKVVYYCGAECQIEDERDGHEDACDLIESTERRLAEEEKKLQAPLPDHGNVFEDAVGGFWEIRQTHPYLVSRWMLMEHLLQIDSADAVQAAVDHILGILRLDNGDHMALKTFLPTQLLRLGRDQESYDYAKWCLDDSRNADFRKAVDMKDSDIFESVNFLVHPMPTFKHLYGIVAVTLVKIKLLIDLETLIKSEMIASKVPQEILDIIRSHLVRSAIAKNKSIMDSKDLTCLKEKICSQAMRLYNRVVTLNSDFWPALYNIADNPTASPEDYISYNVDSVELRHSYRSWMETPGAIDRVRDLCN